MKNQNQIRCSKCGNGIDINTALYQQLSDEINKEYSVKFNSLSEQEARLQETIASQVNSKLADEKQKLENCIRKQLTEQKEEELATIKHQLSLKTEETKQFYKTKAELEQVRREKDELQEKITMESEQKYSQKLNDERQKLKVDMEQRLEFKVKEKEYVIDQLKNKLADAQRKAEQGSMQIQGEVQELAIEEYLKACFPQDTINEIKKGVRGADCLQVINTVAKENCGSVYYESKRTKEFQQGWLETFKNEMRLVGATFGVLVTSAMPKNMDRFGLVNGIWICSFHEFKALCYVLRESVIMIDGAYTSQENKGDKMVMLYDFLTSPEFKLHIEAIVDGFTTMSFDLEKERRAMEGLWKKREKMIQKVLLNTNHLYSSIKGIAGNAISPIKSLELPGAQDNHNE